MTTRLPPGAIGVVVLTSSAPSRRFGAHLAAAFRPWRRCSSSQERCGYCVLLAPCQGRKSLGDLCTEAIRLGRLLAELMPHEPEVMGLLALMLLLESRRATRTSPDGDVVVLADQDREQWDRALIAEGQELVVACLRRRRLGPFQLLAAIQALHCAAPRYEDTDWAAILRFYDRLLTAMPTNPSNGTRWQPWWLRLPRASARACLKIRAPTPNWNTHHKPSPMSPKS